MWFYFALASSVVAAVSTVYNKNVLKRISPRLLAWALFAFPIPLLAAMLFVYPPAHVGNLFWVGVSGSAALFVMSKVWQLEAISTGLLSKLMPLSPLVVLFSYVTGLIFLGERISPAGLLGMFLIVVGAYLLNIKSVREGLYQPFLILVRDRESFLYILSLFFGALSAMFDKVGLVSTAPANPVLTLLVENVLTVIPFTAYLILKNAGWVKQLKDSVGQLAVAGFLYSLSVIFIFYGFSQGPVALTIAIRQSQILFVMLMGIALYRDRPPKETWAATLVMIAGVVILKIG